MSFISYAQNYEDVMLWRALKHINKGFYIDVGAWSPDIDSVTKLFYKNGWSGINIEPNSEYHALLEKKRKNDINIRIALSDKPGRLEMNFLSNPGLSTLDDEIAEQHEIDGIEHTRHQVEVATLSLIWDQHIDPDKEVHFLKIDVEGLEKAVILGNDWNSNRPWIVVVEANLPMSQEESYEAWENILTSADYLHAYSDGLNRFYVSKEHSELLDTFKYPPNVFDEFIPFTLKHTADQARKATERVHILETEKQMLETELQLIYNSRSWAITAPFRFLTSFIHKIKSDK